MSGRRLIAIVIGIFGILILVVAVVLFFITRDTDEQQPTPEVAVGPPSEEAGAEEVQADTTPQPTPALREVVVAFNTVPRGWQMTEAELTTELRQATEIDENVITNLEDAIGMYARNDIYQGETLTTDSLVRDPTLIGVENFGPSSLVPQGWVAMSVPLDRLSSVAYGLAPGDALDVMLSFTLSPIDEQFQTLLSNSASFFLQETGASGEVTQGSVFVIDPLGRFEQVPTGDLAHVAPSEDTSRPVPVSVILQNARVVEVGSFKPRPPLPTPTPTPEPGAPTPTPGGPPPTPTPPPPDVLLLALPPQEQLFLAYALEVSADIDFALRGANDSQLYSVSNVDFAFLLEQFGIEIPPNATFTIGGLETTSLESAEVE